MAMDGLSLYASTIEIAALAGGKIDKIQQPERDELILNIRKDGVNHRLLLSASASHCRAQLTDIKRDNPAEPPMFCMLLRKKLTGGRMISAVQPNFDRVLNITIEAQNDLGDTVNYTLVAEIMGKYSNIILVNEKGIVLDAIRHVGIGVSNKRLVMPGLTYELPPQQDKRDPRQAQEADFVAVLTEAGGRVDKMLSSAFFGLSPVMAGELCASVCTVNDCSALTDEEAEELAKHLRIFYFDLTQGRFNPYLVLNEYNEPMGVFPFKPNSEHIKQMPTLASALDSYYEQYDIASRMQRHGASIRRILQNNIDRCEKKLALYNEAIDSEKDTEKLKLFGELITANLHMLKQGAEEAALINYYLDPPEPIVVPLERQLSPNDNAQRYYKRYQKAKAAKEMAFKYREETLRELEYLDGQMDNLSKCTAIAELSELGDELCEQGYIKRDKKRKAQKVPATKPMHFISSDGTEIFVGKNNRQNDYLTLRLADGDDYWLHTKNIPGSHVIIKNSAPSKQTLYEAAMLAVYYSKARGSENVPVDFTPRRYVKKPAGAKPGMVIYTTNRTAYVTPDEVLIKSLNT